jgi:hypothetical protein
MRRLLIKLGFELCHPDGPLWASQPVRTILERCPCPLFFTFNFPVDPAEDSGEDEPASPRDEQ